MMHKFHIRPQNIDLQQSLEEVLKPDGVPEMMIESEILNVNCLNEPFATADAAYFISFPLGVSLSDGGRVALRAGIPIVHK